MQNTAYMVASMMISLFLFWLTNNRIPGLIVKIICGIHVMYTLYMICPLSHIL